MKNLMPLLLLVCCSLSYAQESPKGKIVGYYDKDWKQADSVSAYYFRTVENKVKFYIVRNYFRSGKLQMEARAVSYKPELILNGLKTEYYENGKVKEEGNYEKGYPSGSYRSFYDNGNLEKDIFFAGDVMGKSSFKVYNSADGQNLLPYGSGTVPMLVDGEVLYHEVENGVMRSSFVIEANGDTVYNVTDEFAGYSGGATQMSSDIMASLEYPRLARKRMEHGVVYVMFTIDENGKVTNPKAVKGFYDLCDAEAVRVIQTLDRWSAAKHHDKNVKSRAIVPIRFAMKVKYFGDSDDSMAGAVLMSFVRMLQCNNCQPMPTIK